MRITKQYAESLRAPLPKGAVDRTGIVQQRLTFLWPTSETETTAIKWIALCSCGNYALVSRRSGSCGCLNEKPRKLPAAAIFDVRSSNKSNAALAAQYGVGASTIHRIRKSLCIS